MMKKYFAYSIIFAGLALGSCSESFLDQNPPLYIEPDDIYNNPQRLESTLLGLYSAIKNTSDESFLGGKTYMVFDNRSEDIVNVDENLITLANTYNFKVSSTDTENTTTWNNAYAAINKVNTYLENLETAKDVAGDKYGQFKAEAKFVRAIAYFYLNNLYSKPFLLDENAKSVPLRLKAEGDGSNNGMPRSTVKQVYEQILDDLSDVNSLPVKNKLDESNVTRATQAAAYMLKMRVYMAMGMWKEAVEAGKAVSGYSLTAKFADLFKAPYYTDETIFTLPMSDTNRPNTQQSLGEYYNASKAILEVDMNNGIMSKEGYNISSDARVLMKNEDGRLQKFVDYSTKLDWVPIFRYAETILNLAECYVNLGLESDARECLKIVRRRSVSAENDIINIDSLSGNELKTAVYNERRLEFIGEGLRGIDVMRRGDSFERVSPVTPSNNGYVWPIPQSEQLMNPDLNK
ncbi:MAG: RagB/SusD family nutrient uptake outer membrane protein [Phocaeicola sp.]|nr:RagB/SusD family nutrient uptake outer membrane protein [Phocaeicola sp.]